MKPSIRLNIDGLVKVAESHGLIQYTTAVGPGSEEDGLVAVCRLVWEDHHHEDFRVSMREAKDLGLVKTHVWEAYSEKMISNLAVILAIRFWFADAVNAVEGRQ